VENYRFERGCYFMKVLPFSRKNEGILPILRGEL